MGFQDDKTRHWWYPVRENERTLLEFKNLTQNMFEGYWCVKVVKLVPIYDQGRKSDEKLR